MLVLIVLGSALGERMKDLIMEDEIRRMVVVLCYLGAIAATTNGVWKMFLG
jgi:uncharacterized membrane protein YfcA